MGAMLAKQILARYPNHDIDVVIPIPDTSRTSAQQASEDLGRPFREGFIKNRYIARTFIMPGQLARKKSVRLKLNTIKAEFAGKNVLLVDDSIVRGTTAREIVQMARDAGAKKVYFTSAAPPIRFPNIYGIDIPTQKELVAYEREEYEVAQNIGADWMLYQNLEDLKQSITSCITPEGKQLTEFDSSCFSGCYVTGQTLDDDYFKSLYARNNDANHGTSGNYHQSYSEPNNNTDELTLEKMGSSNGSYGEGCESMSNDRTLNNGQVGGGCESMNNNNTV